MANCKIFDTLKRSSATGEAAANAVKVYITIVTLPKAVASAYYSGQTFEATTDTNGDWEFYVPQGAVVLLECEEFGFRKGNSDSQKTIPAEATKRWSLI